MKYSKQELVPQPPGHSHERLEHACLSKQVRQYFACISVHAQSRCANEQACVFLTLISTA